MFSNSDANSLLVNVIFVIPSWWSSAMLMSQGDFIGAVTNLLTG